VSCIGAADSRSAGKYKAVAAVLEDKIGVAETQQPKRGICRSHHDH
jgi:hypothetical protein